jgi:hypothetical protein
MESDFGAWFLKASIMIGAAGAEKIIILSVLCLGCLKVLSTKDKSPKGK